MVTAPNDDWTEDMCKKLINEYRKQPILWDTNDPYFFKKGMRPEAWEAIGAALQIPAHLCKHKMVVLQSSFRREKSKMMQSIRDMPGQANFTSTWFAFEEMAFLIDKTTERKRQSAAINDKPEDNDDLGTNAIKRSLIEHYNEKNSGSRGSKKKCTKSKIGTVLPNTCSSSSSSERTTVTVTEIQQILQEKKNAAMSPATGVPTTLPPLVPARKLREDTLEEIKSFTDFIAYKMKKYTETTKNAVQQAICDIIFKADQNLYDSVAFGDTVVVEDCDSQNKTNGIGNSDIIKIHFDDSD